MSLSLVAFFECVLQFFSTQGYLIARLQAFEWCNLSSQKIHQITVRAFYNDQMNHRLTDSGDYCCLDVRFLFVCILSRSASSFYSIVVADDGETETVGKINWICKSVDDELACWRDIQYYMQWVSCILLAMLRICCTSQSTSNSVVRIPWKLVRVF